MRRQSGLVVVALVVLVSLGGCVGSGGPRQAIIGTWAQVGGGDTYIFTTDGSVTINGELGTYEFLDDTHLHIDIHTVHYSSYTWGVKIDGDLLHLTTQNGRTLDFKRQN